jgi:hypothetical protein
LRWKVLGLAVGGLRVHLYSSPPQQGGTRREFRRNLFPETGGRPLTQRHLPTTLRKADDTFRTAKVQIILLRVQVFFVRGGEKNAGAGEDGYHVNMFASRQSFFFTLITV